MVIQLPRESQFEVLVNSPHLLVKLQEQLKNVVYMGVTMEQLDIIGLEPSVFLGCTMDMNSNGAPPPHIPKFIPHDFSSAHNILRTTPLNGDAYNYRKNGPDRIGYSNFPREEYSYWQRGKRPVKAWNPSANRFKKPRKSLNDTTGNGPDIGDKHISNLSKNFEDRNEMLHEPLNITNNYSKAEEHPTVTDKRANAVNDSENQATTSKGISDTTSVHDSAKKIKLALNKIHGELEKHRMRLNEKIKSRNNNSQVSEKIPESDYLTSAIELEKSLLEPNTSTSKSSSSETDTHFLPFKNEDLVKKSTNINIQRTEYKPDVNNLKYSNSIVPKSVFKHKWVNNANRIQRPKHSMNTWKKAEDSAIPRFQGIFNLKIDNKHLNHSVNKGRLSYSTTEKKNILINRGESLLSYKQNTHKLPVSLEDKKNITEESKQKNPNLDIKQANSTNDKKRPPITTESEQRIISNEISQTPKNLKKRSEKICQSKNEDQANLYSRIPLINLVVNTLKEKNIDGDLYNFISHCAKYARFTSAPRRFRDRKYPDAGDNTLKHLYSVDGVIVLPQSYISSSNICRYLEKYFGVSGAFSEMCIPFGASEARMYLDTATIRTGSTSFMRNGISADTRKDIDTKFSSLSLNDDTSENDTHRNQNTKAKPQKTKHESMGTDIFDIFVNAFKGSDNTFKDSLDVSVTLENADSLLYTSKDNSSDYSSFMRVPLILRSLKELLNKRNAGEKSNRYFDNDPSINALSEKTKKEPKNETAWIKYAFKLMDRGQNESDLIKPTGQKIMEAIKALSLGLSHNPNSRLLWNTYLELYCRGGDVDTVRKLFRQATKIINNPHCEQIWWRWCLWEKEYKHKIKILEEMIKVFAEEYIQNMQPLKLGGKISSADNIFDIIIYMTHLMVYRNSLEGGIKYLYIFLTSKSIFDIIGLNVDKAPGSIPKISLKSTLPHKYFSSFQAAYLWLVYFYMVHFRTFPDSIMDTYPYYFIASQRPFLINWSESLVEQSSLDEASHVDNNSDLLLQFTVLLKSWRALSSVDSNDYRMLILNYAFLYKIYRNKFMDMDEDEENDPVQDICKRLNIQYDLSSPENLTGINLDLAQIFNNLPMALNICKAIISTSPDNIYIWNRCANISINLGHIPEALEALVNCAFKGLGRELETFENFYEATNATLSFGELTNIGTFTMEGTDEKNLSKIDKALEIYRDALNDMKNNVSRKSTNISTFLNYMSLLLIKYILYSNEGRKDEPQIREFQNVLNSEDSAIIFWEEYLTFNIARKDIPGISQHVLDDNSAILRDALASLSGYITLPLEFQKYNTNKSNNTEVEEVGLDLLLPLPHPYVTSRLLSIYIRSLEKEHAREYICNLVKRQDDVRVDSGAVQLAFCLGEFDTANKVVARLVAQQPLLRTNWRASILVALLGSFSMERLSKIIEDYNNYFPIKNG